MIVAAHQLALVRLQLLLDGREHRDPLAPAAELGVRAVVVAQTHAHLRALVQHPLHVLHLHPAPPRQKHFSSELDRARASSTGPRDADLQQEQRGDKQEARAERRGGWVDGG